MVCLGGWYFRMTCEKRCLKRLEGFQRVKHLARLFVRTKTQVNECFSVVFHKDAILEISPVQGSEFLHHPANMLLVLCRVCRLHDIPIGGNDHLESSSFCSRGKSCPSDLRYRLLTSKDGGVPPGNHSFRHFLPSRK